VGLRIAHRLAVSAVAALALAVTPGSGASSAGLSFVSIDGGDESYCALTAAGGVFCWGWNAWGNAGEGTHVDRSRPVPVLGLSGGVKAVSADRNHACALMRAGTVECWGANYWASSETGRRTTAAGRCRSSG
jgi:alpha-tubulin suppressor-like RCC1 family protein